MRSLSMPRRLPREELRFRIDSLCISMEQELLEELRAWFDDYVTGFYGEDEYVNANLKMKQSHSRRTCTVMLDLADQIGLASENLLVLGVIVVFYLFYYPFTILAEERHSQNFISERLSLPSEFFSKMGLILGPS